jgi:hypothetical protein
VKWVSPTDASQQLKDGPQRRVPDLDMVPRRKIVVCEMQNMICLACYTLASPADCGRQKASCKDYHTAQGYDLSASTEGHVNDQPSGIASYLASNPCIATGERIVHTKMLFRRV